MTTGAGATPEPGGELGPFRLGKRLGIGGMGIVFQALDTQLNRQVALKIITPHIGEDPGFRARFTREAQAQASLDSPHVVQVYSFGEADGRLYIATQLIPDGDLGQMLHRHGRPPVRVGVNLISQIADGLAVAHQAGLIHRDIKPANVLLRRRDNELHAYLGDFGIARHVSGGQQLTQVGGTVGTPSYMAPELHTGGQAGPASDIYSLGCLLWASLSGHAPYSGTSDYQVVRGHLEAPVPQLAETGPLASEINRALRSAMAKDPADRYPTVATMRDDLRRIARLPDDPQPIRLPDDSAPLTPPTQHQQHLVTPRTPTPTPTPTPGPTGGPPAPPFMPTPTPTPQFATQPFAPSRGSSSGGGRRGLLIALAVALVVAVAATVTILLLAGGDDDTSADPTETTDTTSESTDPTGPTDPTDPTVPSPPTPPTSDPIEPTPSESTGTNRPTGGNREKRAVDSLAAFFGEQSGIDPPIAQCIGEGLVEEYGVDGLVDIGVLNDELEFQPTAEAASSDFIDKVYDVSFTCGAESVGAG
ncbi:hypothetical protein GCM10023340_06440 [Nocardioides marinquilinus]|uniref:non-specific serine/threonine protein kinase n=1 Tax=Nocardioides marinquilinus TaxID=1210400 RepID=A0ABP9P937_9ACTN